MGRKGVRILTSENGNNKEQQKETHDHCLAHVSFRLIQFCDGIAYLKKCQIHFSGAFAGHPHQRNTSIDRKAGDGDSMSLADGLAIQALLRADTPCTSEAERIWQVACHSPTAFPFQYSLHPQPNHSLHASLCMFCLMV